LAAALAYFGMFSFAPVIYIAYRLAGIFINEAAAGERLYARLEVVLGAETAAFIQDSVSAISAANAGGSLIMSVVSFITLLFAAMGLFLQLTCVLNRIWGVPLIQAGEKVAIIRQRLFAFFMVIALGLLVILATAVNVVSTWFGSVIKDFLGGSTLLEFRDTKLNAQRHSQNT
jgi:membrane protein